jgi:TctA family transporter
MEHPPSIRVTGASVPVITGFEAGVHINAAQSVLDATPAAKAYVVSPASPVCVWAGSVPTVFFKFPDQATAQSVLSAYWTPDALVK